MGPSGPATSLRGNMCWVRDRVAGGEGRGRGSQGDGVAGRGGVRKVSGPVGELDEGEREGHG